MDIHDWIALLSFLGALLSALYARWTFNEARKANNIAIHHHQKEIFDAFNTLRDEINQLGENFNLEALSKYSAHAYTADLYLSNYLSCQIKQYNHFANKLYLRSQMNKAISNNDNPIPEKYLEKIWLYTDKCRELEQSIEGNLREELSLQTP